MQKCYEWPTLGWQLWCEQMFGGLCLITWLHISQSQQNILQHSQHWHSHTLCLISISNHNYEECRMNVEYLQSTLCIQIMHLLQIAKLTTKLLLSISLTISSIIQCSLYNFQFNLTWLYSVIHICDVHRSGCVCYTCEYCSYSSEGCLPKKKSIWRDIVPTSYYPLPLQK